MKKLLLAALALLVLAFSTHMWAIKALFNLIELEEEEADDVA